MKKRHFLRILFICGIAVLLCMAVFVPGEFLMWQSRAALEQVSMVPKESYQAEDSALAREASAKLSKEEKLRLIQGTWESEKSEAEDYEMQLQTYEAVMLAREKTAELYKEGQFGVDLSGVYQNWYGWKARAYKVVDTTFHTYTAYYWEITFEKYDRTESYVVRMLEDGTIFE